ncbi:hypothetical protein pdam_00007231 [Pocillopora damicornis]|uniref:Calnexin n=1 Tax=Pocillopora damicornis TaxID=46731 RepID=A0A3M6US49_POCDA|nr:hypothetical protein pdam_00007231 [Pocillopora damicornis]
MRLKQILVYLALVVLLCTLSSWAADDGKEKKKAPEIEPYKPPVISLENEDSVFFSEPFAIRGEFQNRWLKSQAKKDGVDVEIAKYDGEWSFEEPATKLFSGDLGLVLKAMECGGAYVKLLSQQDSFDLKTFHDKSPYTIMFGPDKCGEDKKLHFIFRHKNPKTGEYEEKHAKKPTGNFQNVFDGKKTHLFTLVVRPDNSFEVFVDQTSVNSGNLLEDVTPAVNPPKEIDDPNDKKPDDWDEREKIPDPDAEKPDDWDEDAPTKIPDPDAKSGCGEWKAPFIDNPAYKGKWSPPLVDNPDYKGIWKPRKIDNPDYFEDKEPFKMTSIAAVGLELWSMTPDILFDNFIITNDKSVADKWASDSWVKKNGGIVNNLLEATNERPWLWVLFVIVVILPFVLIAACCFPGSKSDAAKKKKTDEPTEDVPADENEEAETKGDDEEETAAGDEEAEEKNEEEEEKKEAEGNEEEEPAGKDEVDEEETERMPTRRRPRKDN